MFSAVRGGGVGGGRDRATENRQCKHAARTAQPTVAQRERRSRAQERLLVSILAERPVAPAR
jgi:hypothetical protein